jgi:hypothetical protein
VVFDDGNELSDSVGIGWQSEAVDIEGTYNTVTGCSLINGIRYGFTTWGADHFTISNNTVYKAQYGISGGDGGSNPPFATNGLVTDNKIYDCMDCGIKMKMWKNVTITNNYVDVGYKTWGSQNPANGHWGMSPESDGCIGIRYYHADTPTIDCTVSNNNIVDTTKTPQKGIGMLVDPDLHLDWSSCPYPASGERILNNYITVPWYGIIIQGNGVLVQGNDCSAASVGIRIDSNNNQIIGNRGSIQNNGIGNVIL